MGVKSIHQGLSKRQRRTHCESGQHASRCLCLHANKAIIVDSDCSDARKQFVEEQCTSNAHDSDLPEKIWMDTDNHFHETIGNDFKGLIKTQVRNLVYHAYNYAFGEMAFQSLSLSTLDLIKLHNCITMLHVLIRNDAMHYVLLRSSASCFTHVSHGQ